MTGVEVARLAEPEPLRERLIMVGVAILYFGALFVALPCAFLGYIYLIAQHTPNPAAGIAVAFLIPVGGAFAFSILYMTGWLLVTGGRHLMFGSHGR